MSDTKDIIRLNHNQYDADIRAFLDARRSKKEHDRESRACDGVIKNLRSLLFLAMKGASIARCGKYLITIKPERHNQGALTLKDGRSIPLSEIVEIVINKGNDVIQASDVKTWYGGAVIGADLEITLTSDD